MNSKMITVIIGCMKFKFKKLYEGQNNDFCGSIINATEAEYNFFVKLFEKGQEFNIITNDEIYIDVVLCRITREKESDHGEIKLVFRQWEPVKVRH